MMPTDTSVPSKKDSIKISVSSLNATVIAGKIASFVYTFEIPKLEPALFGFIKHGSPTLEIMNSRSIASHSFKYTAVAVLIP